MKKKILILLLTLFMVFTPCSASAKEKEKVKIYIFYGEGCPHCHAAFEFFDSIEKEYGKYYDLKKFEVWNSNISWDSNLNKKLMEKVHDVFGPEDKDGVPYMIIGDEVVLGYEEASNEKIINTIMEQYEKEDKEDKATPLVTDMIKDRTILYGSWYGSLILLCVLIIINYSLRIFQK